MTIQEMLDRKAELGYSNAVLAEKSGVPLSTVQKVLGGFTHAPRKKTLRALEAALLREKAAEEASMLRESYENALPELTASPKKSRKSVDYRRAELIDGQVFPLPAPSPLHQEIIVRLLVLLANHFSETRNPARLLPPPFGIRPRGEDGGDYFEPDLMTVSDLACLTETGCLGAPDWVLEVTSPATKFRDYTVKPFKYRTGGVRECWIVDPDARVVITYWFGGSEEEMKVYAFGEDVPFSLYPGLTARL